MLEWIKTNDKKYNGYTNYETWLMALNIDNDKGLYEMIQTDIISENQDLDDYELGDLIKEAIEELAYNEEFNIYKLCDTWTYRDFQEIDWSDIAHTERQP